MKAIILTTESGKSLLDHYLTCLKEAGISEILVKDCAPTGSIHSLWLSKKELFHDGFMILDTGTMYDKQFLFDFIHHERKTACAVDNTAPFKENEYHVVIQKGRIIRCSKDISPGESCGSAGHLVKIGTGDLSLFWGRVEEIIQNEGAQHDFLKACDVVMFKSDLWPVFTKVKKQNLSWHILQMKSQAGSTVESIKSSCQFFFQSFIPAFFVHPVLACRLLKLFLTGSLTSKGFDLQVYGPQLLRITLEEAHKAGINPFLVWGTLLGCVREGRFIINDDDIDLAVLSEDFPKAQLLIKPMLERGFIIRHNNEHQLSFQHPRRHKSFAVDIDRVCQKDGHMMITSVLEKENNDFSYVFPLDTFSSLKTVKFVEGMDVLIPSQPEKFLETAYGNWKAPQKKGHWGHAYLNFVLEPKAE